MYFQRFLINLCLLTEDGGSILMDGSHSPGGRTVTASRNSSKPTIYNVVFIQTKLKGGGIIFE